jgi:hypothetical protein
MGTILLKAYCFGFWDIDAICTEEVEHVANMQLSDEDYSISANQQGQAKWKYVVLFLKSDILLYNTCQIPFLPLFQHSQNPALSDLVLGFQQSPVSNKSR